LKYGRPVTIDKSVFSGTHYEMGFQQGKQYRQQIQQGIKTLLDSDIVKENKPKLLPQWLFFAIAKRRAEKLLKKDILENYPNQANINH
jgi:hypothetical protein